MTTDTDAAMHLIEIEYAGGDEWERLKPVHTIAEDEDRWQIKTPIVPRVGDVLRFDGWNLRVTEVKLSIYSSSQQIKGLPDAFISVQFIGDDESAPLVNFAGVERPKP